MFKKSFTRVYATLLSHVCVCNTSLACVWNLLCSREQRATDVSVEKCKRRYEIFKQHYSATMRLKHFFREYLLACLCVFGGSFVCGCVRAHVSQSEVECP